MGHQILFTLQVDCEATQSSLRDAALGERAVRGVAELLAETGMKATFAVIPSDLRASAGVYRELASQGHEIGLHVHPAEQGYEEFLGVYGYDQQREIIRSAADEFANLMGHRPLSFTPGYFSANDYTFQVLEELGFKHGTVSLPTRDLPQCACVWGHAPLDAHYPHRYNRCLSGEVDFVEIPPTIDPDSRLWGGAHPQDLRVELVDAKNHWYTISKSVERQISAAASIPVKYLKATTHNVFAYDDRSDFRRQTLAGIVRASREICAQRGVEIVPATTAEIARQYRQLVPRPQRLALLELDTRGRAFL
jgi:peptidoglycan/xylan/chitin deacetylase (PgdA/CDA1 family)